MMTDSVLQGVTQPAAPPPAEDSDAADRLVSMLCRRMARQHACREHCQHRNHRRDMAYAAHLFAMLEVSGEPSRTEDYSSALPYHSMTHQESRSEIASASGGAASHGYRG